MKKNIIRTMKGLYDLDAKCYVTEAEAAESEQTKDKAKNPKSK